MPVDVDESDLANRISGTRECPDEEGATATNEERTVPVPDRRSDFTTQCVGRGEDAVRSDQSGPRIAFVTGDPDREVAGIEPTEAAEALVTQDSGRSLGSAWVAVPKPDRVNWDADDREALARHGCTVAEQRRRRRPGGWGEPAWPGRTVSILILVD
jgi:hypothetical protein